MQTDLDKSQGFILKKWQIMIPPIQTNRIPTSQRVIFFPERISPKTLSVFANTITNDEGSKEI